MSHFYRAVFQEFGPVTLFFLTTVALDFTSGVVALVTTTIFSVAWSVLQAERLPWFAILAGATVVLLGGATIVTDNPLWITLEYTLSNALFGLVLFGGTWLGYYPLRFLFVDIFAITDRAWRILAWRWGSVFIVSAILSHSIWLFYGEETWVTYRFGSAIFFLVFGMLQFTLARKERLPEANSWGLRVQALPK